MRTSTGLLLAVTLVAWASAHPSPVGAASNGSSGGASGTSEDIDFRNGRTAVEAKRYEDAIVLLRRAVSRDANNADALNLLGYSHRKLGRFEESHDWYEKALTVNPNHRGANEYLGELYLQTGNLEKAEAQLARLDKICFFGCDEYDELKEAIENYKEGRSGAREDW